MVWDRGRACWGELGGSRLEAGGRIIRVMAEKVHRTPLTGMYQDC